VMHLCRDRVQGPHVEGGCGFDLDCYYFDGQIHLKIDGHLQKRIS
jgi:hypothetical protein